MENSFFRDLVAKSAEPKVLTTTVRVLSDADRLDKPDKLLDILGLGQDVISETGRSALDALESRKSDENADWIDFKWKVSAFIETQDIFDARIMTGSFLNAFHLWYFYFESKHLLNESIICGFNGLYAASNALLRLFLEFNILQNYYYRAVWSANSYKPLEKYFETHKHPGWHSLLKGALPNEPFAKPIRFRLQMQMKALSEHFSHPYHPEDSPRQHAHVLSMPSLEGIFFWMNLSFLLEVILWTYYVNFPMLFHPKNTLKKFGYNAPVGLFIDEYAGATVRKSLKEEEYHLFFKYSSSHDVVKSLTEWYESCDALTEEEIIRSWNKEEDGELRSMFAGYALQKAKLRGLRGLMALKPAVNPSEGHEEPDYDAISSYKFWDRISKRKKKHARDVKR
jgi:hypothetical protein